MSEPNDPSNPRDREERAILAALAALEVRDPERALDEALRPDPAPGAESEATLRRLYVETLGLMAWGAPAETPPERVKDRLMAAISGGEGAGAAASEAPPDSRPEGAGVVPFSARPRPGVPRPRPGRAARMVAALAAAFAAGALGLAGWFYGQLDRSREALARLADERAFLQERVARQEELIRTSGGREELVAAMATAGLKVCPLRPVGGPALDSQAFAILYMPPGSADWYLLASNLEPGRGVYKVWLNTPDGAMPIGRLDPGQGSALEFAAPPMDGGPPPMQSIAVTLEPSPDTTGPTGPMVLFGDEMLTIL